MSLAWTNNPALLLNPWATNTGTTVTSGLNVDTINWQTGVYHRAVFSGSPDLSGVVIGHQITISGATNSVNNGTFTITAVSDSSDYIEYVNAASTNAANDESSSPATASVSNSKSVSQAPSTAQQGQGFRNNQRPPAGWLNYQANNDYNLAGFLLDSMSPDYLLGKRLTAGTNITLADNDILSSLVVTDAEYQSQEYINGKLFGVIRYTFSGTPTLSSVTAGSDRIVVTGCSNASNNGTYLIKTVNDGSDYVDVYSATRTDDTDDETGITAAADIHDGTQRISASITISTVEAIGGTYTQASHGFAAKDVVRHNGTQWTKAQGNTIAGATDVYLVTAVDGNDFTAAKAGRVTITGHGLSAGTLYYLSAGTAGLLTTTKPVGDTTTPLGFFLPVVYVESANVLHVLGQGYPTIDQLLAEYVNTTGSDVNHVTFSNLTVADWGGSIRFKAGMANQTTGAVVLSCRINGSSSSAYNHTHRYDDGTNWDRVGATGQTFWDLAYNEAIGSADQPLTIEGVFQLSKNSGTMRARFRSTYEAEGTNRIFGQSWGDYSSVTDITSVQIGDISSGGQYRFRASANHYVRLYRP